MNTSSSSSKTWLLSLGLYISLIVTFWLDLTGISLHEWLGIIIGIIAFVYIVLGWKSIQAIPDRHIRDSNHIKLILQGINLIIMIGVLSISATGLVISTWLRLKIDDYVSFYYLHVAVSILTLITVAIRIGLSWRGIIQIIKTWFTLIITPKATPTIIQSGSFPDPLGRREFVSLMGLVAIGSVFALFKAFQGVETAARHANQINAGITRTQPGSAGGRASDACVIRCPGRCVNTGKCMRWIDRDGDRRCDQGECT